MPNLSEFLDKFNLKYEDLTGAERATLSDWIKKLSSKSLTLEDVKTHIGEMIKALERGLFEPEEPKTFWSVLFHRNRDKHRLARLQNLLMLQDFLTGPEKAKRWIEDQMNNLKPN